MPHQHMNATQQTSLVTPVPIVMLPFGADTFAGPVNTNVGHSFEANGIDLPMHGLHMNRISCVLG